jgi:hypothetical protein
VELAGKPQCTLPPRQLNPGGGGESLCGFLGGEKAGGGKRGGKGVRLRPDPFMCHIAISVVGDQSSHGGQIFEKNFGGETAVQLATRTRLKAIGPRARER